MRKIYALLLALVATVALQAQTQDNAMYVYRNDGGFNAFLREDIDSITLSHFDLDSIEHQTPVCQVFFTPDSIYRIPIEAIDSVSFVQPETKYASGVILLNEQSLHYIVEVTENTITFSSSTPSELLPKKGNVLAAMVFEGVLSEGFAGRIDNETITDKGIQFECSDVSIEDIYDHFVYTGKTIAADETAMSRMQKLKSRSSGVKTFNIETIHASSGSVSVDAHPIITAFYTINRNKNLKTHQSIIVKADIDIDVSLEVNVEVGETPHVMWHPGTINIPTNVPGLYGFIRGGAFYKTTAAASVNATCPGHIYWKFGFVNGDDGLNFIWNYKSSIQRPEFSVNMNGELDAGFCARIGFGVVSEKVASIYLTGYAGLYAKADFSLTDAGLLDGTLYSSLKDSQLEAGAYLSGEPGYTVMEKEFTWSKEEEKDIDLSWEHRFPFRTWYLLPEFADLQVNKGADKTSAIIQSSASRDLLMPVQLGLSVENDCGEVVATKWCDGEYRLENNWPSNALWQQFEELESGKTYTAYPYVRILGQELKASPSKEFKTESEACCVDANHPHMVDLGLSVKWACCNVGANAPEEYGGYYAWGETEEKNDYSTSGDTYQYWVDKNGNGYIDENEGTITTDIAGTQYDVAYVKWGSSWRMPTKAEIQELAENCSWQWVTVNGVGGQKVTGPKGNSIFLPAAGERAGTFLNDAGDYGYCWSSTTNEYLSGAAHVLYFNSFGCYWRDCLMKTSGDSVRPVSE